MKSKFLFFAIGLIIVAACQRESKPNLSLPAITTTGQNTLGFMLSNEVWTNYGRRCTIGGCNDNKVSAAMDKQPNGSFELSVTADYTILSKTIDQSFGIFTVNTTTPGTYQLDYKLGRGINFIASRYNQSYKEYDNKFSNTCSLTITKLDTINRIIAGTFSGVLYNPTNLGDSIKITDGRFDAQLIYRK
jgi:hypothetical protein